MIFYAKIKNMANRLEFLQGKTNKNKRQGARPLGHSYGGVKTNKQMLYESSIPFLFLFVVAYDLQGNYICRTEDYYNSWASIKYQ